MTKLTAILLVILYGFYLEACTKKRELHTRVSLVWSRQFLSSLGSGLGRVEFATAASLRKGQVETQPAPKEGMWEMLEQLVWMEPSLSWEG